MFLRLKKAFPVVLLFFIFFLSAAGGTALAASKKITVVTYIDNISEYPEITDRSFIYAAGAFTSLTSSYSYIYTPKNPGTKVFTFRHGLTQDISIDIRDTQGTWKFYFMPASGTNATDDRLSLERVEKISACAGYTYNNNGHSSIPLTFFNYVEVTNSYWGNPKVELHFRYNGELKSTKTVFDPQLTYSKKIDWLYDNAGESVSGRTGLNDYRLYLDAFTDYDVAPEYKRKNIIFILDCSGSMAYGMTGNQTAAQRDQRMTKLKEQASSMIRTLSQDPENRYSVIRFAGAGTSECSILRNRGTADQALTAVAGLKAEGGTNYYTALELSGSCLADSSYDNVIIFITDGEPTAVPQDKMGNLFSGTDTEYPVALPYAVQAAKKLPGDRIQAFYAILINEDRGYGSALQTVAQCVGTAGDRASVMVSSERELKNVLDAITIKLVKKASELTISDTLSENAVYIGTPVVTAWNEGVQRELIEGTDYFLTAEGNLVEAAIQNVEPRTKYTLSFDIGASALAVRKLSGGQRYTDTGDQDTDCDRNGTVTSSGKAGFYSNSEGFAKLSWQDGYALYVYKKPVLQVYIPEGTETSIEALKVLHNENTGLLMPVNAGDFQFKLFSVEGGVTRDYGTVPCGEGGSITFTGIPVPDILTHEFYIREDIPEEQDPHIDYDDRRIHVLVHTDYDPFTGELFVSDVESVTGEQPVFTNIYHYAPAYAEIGAVKELSGYVLREGKFRFVLHNNKGEFVADALNKADGTVSFGKLKFTVPGNYTLIMTENRSWLFDKHVTYDTSELKALVNVSDDGTGDLTAELSYPNGNIFRNDFSMTPDEGIIKAHVTLYGMELTKGMFTFGLYDESGELIETKGNDINGEITFDPRRYDRYEDLGEYHFTVRQIIPDEESSISHMVYDDGEISVTMKVDDGGTGDIDAVPVYSREGKEEDENHRTVRFVNAYELKASME